MKEIIELSGFITDNCKLENNNEAEGNFRMAEGTTRVIFQGLVGKVGGVEWDEDKFFAVDLVVHKEFLGTMIFEFWSEDNLSDTANITVRYGILPNIKVQVGFSLKELKSRRFFIPTFPGSFKGQVDGKPMDAKKVNRFSIGILKNYKECLLEISNIYLSDTEPEHALPEVKLVDEMGQLKTKDWPGKTKSVDELNKYLLKEYEEALGEIKQFEDRDEYGGWKKKQFNATGFFKVEHDGNRWWLIDPIGHPFYSSGMAYGCRMGEFGWTEDVEKLYDWLPDKNDPIFKQAWITADLISEYKKRNGAAAGVQKHLFNFPRTNMIRTFGEDWWMCWTKLVRKRLIQWGINTIGVGVNNYEDERVEEFLRAVKIPYVWTLKGFPTTKHNIFRDFPDVFSKEYRDNASRFAEQIRKFDKDPFMIGYFINNEPEWVFEDTINLAEQLLDHELELETKEEFIKFISARYGADLQRFNEAWNLKLKSFEELKRKISNASKLSGVASKDLEDFNDIMIIEYSKIPSEVIKKLDPNHLNLGMRYSYPHKKTFISYENFDAFSFNLYTENPYELIETVGSITNKPVLIGEFHFGAADRGLFNSALKAADNQEERGKAYSLYAENAAVSKYSIGVHYFELNDQPLLGRFDGEGMQHGCIDVCNKPYTEMVSAITDTNKVIYEVANGDRKPMHEKPKYVDSMWE